MADGNLPHVPSPTGIDSCIRAFTSLRTVLSTAGQDYLIEASRSLRIASSTAGQGSFIEASGSLGTAPSWRIRQSSLPHVATTTTSTTIAKRFLTTTVINFRVFAEQMDAVIKSNSAAKVNPSAEAIAEEVLRQQQHHVIEARIKEHGTGVSWEQ